MSKNFELLTRLGESIAPETTPSSTEGPGHQVPDHLENPPRRAESSPPPTALRNITWARPSDEAGQASAEDIGLVQQLFLAAGNGAPRSVVFSGVDDREGSESICSRGGEVLAALTTGGVCLVDAALDAPSLHLRYRTENKLGLTDAVLTGGDVLSFARQIRSDNLWLLPAGSQAGKRHSVLPTDRLRQAILELQNQFDYVLISAPPVNLYPDAILLGQLTDGVVLVLKAGSTRRATAMKVKNSLDASNVALLGAVLSERTYPIPDALYRKF